MIVVAVFGLLFLQGFNLFTQLGNGLERFLKGFAQRAFLLVEPLEWLVFASQRLAQARFSWRRRASSSFRFIHLL
ncbi:hypothetical protein [Ktedonospora formicarum]|uniref:hypothetical protein n=1 Tax=Ktedonospora formicarum TaxID=2778364 RepID=UPI001F45B575|nr:hypothetical protein [Ktedonospora formicarum]